MRHCLLLIGLVLQSGFALAQTELGIQDARFTINGKPTFLLGISYYGALGAPDGFVKEDLNDLQRHGFNWIRVWATWAAFDHNVSAVQGDGGPRNPYLDRLKNLIVECDKRGIIVDVTLSRENGVTGPPRLLKPEEHRRAVETLIEVLKPYRNWYLDLANERNIRDTRFVSHEALKTLRDRAKELDPKRLITASHSSSDEDFIAELDQYLKDTRVDFVSPHRGRYQGTADQTEAMTGRFILRMKELDAVIPIHYQEPFRRGFAGWEPGAQDFFRDLRGALKAGAAGWCFHNGAQRDAPQKQPRRSFDLRERRLLAQFDDVEKTVVEGLKNILSQSP